jgi:hypothetical protein
MKKCAFLTLDGRGDYVIDDEHAVEPLEALSAVPLYARIDFVRDDQQDFVVMEFGPIPLRPCDLHGLSTDVSESVPANVWNAVLACPLVDRIDVITADAVQLLLQHSPFGPQVCESG